MKSRWKAAGVGGGLHHFIVLLFFSRFSTSIALWKNVGRIKTTKLRTFKNVFKEAKNLMKNGQQLGGKHSRKDDLKVCKYPMPPTKPV